MSERIVKLNEDGKIDFGSRGVRTHGEIVRCRDCKYYKDYGDGGTKCDNTRWNTVIYGAYVSPLVTSEGYCAWGEKR